MNSVAFVTDALESGGAERQLTLLAAALLRHHWQPRIVRYRPEAFYALPAGCEDRVLTRRFPGDPRMLLGLGRELRRPRVDIAHLWKPQAAAYAGVMGLGPWRVPSVLHLHTGAAHLRDNPIAARSYLVAALLADHVVGVCGDGLDWLASCGVPWSRLSWIPNLVGDEMFSEKPRPQRVLAALRQRLGLPADAAAPVLVLGRVDENKNPSGVATALARLKRTGTDVPPLLLVGAVASKAELARTRAIAAEAALDFRHHGPIDDVAGLLDAACIVVLGSHAEGMPMVALEGMARGAIVVAPATGDVARVMTDGETGFVARQRKGRTHSDDLARSIGSALALSTRGRATMSASAKRHASASFAADAIAPKWLELYERLRTERRGPIGLDPRVRASVGRIVEALIAPLQ
jgi:glycosyltransferase involved in cell wall biosynthesis